MRSGCFLTATTRQFNGQISQVHIDKEISRDPAKNQAEYLSTWRLDIERFISREALEAVVVPGRFQLAPTMGEKYRAFTDVSGGVSDAFALCIAHTDRSTEKTVVDFLWQRPAPFDPEAVVGEAVAHLKTYNCHEVTGDNYSAAWASMSFQRRGISYCKSEHPRSELYANLLPTVMSGRIELLDNRLSIEQLFGLERRTTRVGRDIIDHKRGGHDDLSNTIAGVAHDNKGASTRCIARSLDGSITYSDSDDSPEQAARRARQLATMESGGVVRLSGVRRVRRA